MVKEEGFPRPLPRRKGVRMKQVEPFSLRFMLCLYRILRKIFGKGI